MRNLKYTLAIALMLVAFASCQKDESTAPNPAQNGGQGQNGGGNGTGKEIPEGYFEVVFSSPLSRAAIDGTSNRISDLLYLVFDAQTGEFIKEKHLIDTGGNLEWPLEAVKDTLPRGSYQAVFLGNVQKTLFPYATDSGQAVSDVLTGYTDGYSAARIVLPNAQFTTETEFYMANITFSDTSIQDSPPYILLQRLIGQFKVHRNNVDVNDALTKLVENIIGQMKRGNILEATLTNILPGYLRTAILGIPGIGTLLAFLTGGVDFVINTVMNTILTPVVEAAYDLLLHYLLEQITAILAGNDDQEGFLGLLGGLLNPWNAAHIAIVVTMNDFPKEMTLDRQVVSKFDGLHNFVYQFDDPSFMGEKDLLIKSFPGTVDIREINIVSAGLVSGLVFDHVLDGVVISGLFNDIKEPITLPELPANRRFQCDYSLIDINLDDYTIQDEGPQSFTLPLDLGSIANLPDLLGGMLGLGAILNMILGPILNITIQIPINVPLLSIDNLAVSGGWEDITEPPVNQP